MGSDDSRSRVCRGAQTTARRETDVVDPVGRSIVVVFVVCRHRRRRRQLCCRFVIIVFTRYCRVSSCRLSIASTTRRCADAARAGGNKVGDTWRVASRITLMALPVLSHVAFSLLL